MVGVARKSALDARLAAATRAKLEPVAVDDCAFALCRAFPDADALIDVGESATTLVVPGDPIPLTRTFEIGGDALTAALAASLGIDEATAEQRKRSVGLAGAGEHARDALVEQLASALIETRAAARAELRAIALVGNGARLTGLADALERAVQIPVRLRHAGRRRGERAAARRGARRRAGLGPRLRSRALGDRRVKRINYLVTRSERLVGVALPTHGAGSPAAARSPRWSARWRSSAGCTACRRRGSRTRRARAALAAERLAAGDGAVQRVRAVENDVVRLRGLVQRVAEIRAPGRPQAGALAAIGNGVPADAWLASIRVEHGGYALEGRGARLSAVGTTMAALASSRPPAPRGCSTCTTGPTAPASATRSRWRSAR